jgi:putative NADH-flavin reductase
MGEDDAVKTALVIGASKGIGLETVKAALDAGHIVRAMARQADRIPVRSPDLEKISGDALDPSAVRTALEGVDVVAQTLGVSAGPAMMFKPVSLFSEATRVLVTAMKEGGVDRLISVTGFGAGDSRNRGGCVYNTALQLFLRPAYEDKDEQELLIQESGLDWVIVRPVVLTNGSRTGAYHVLLDPRSWRAGFISRADVADFVVRQFDDDRYLGKAPVLTG